MADSVEAIWAARLVRLAETVGATRFILIGGVGGGGRISSPGIGI